MESQRYKDLFENWEIGLATNVINKFKSQWKCLQWEDFKDLLQECLIDWYFAKDKYNTSAGANQRTFMAKVIEHKLQHIVEKLASNKRKASSEAVSLDEPISKEKGSPTYSDQLPADEDHVHNLQIIIGLKIDVPKALQKLPTRQRELCRLLYEENLSMKEASEVLGIPRTTLYDDIKRIKAIFQKEKLNEYLD